MKVVMDSQYAVGRLTVDIEHDKKNFLREAAKWIATALLENGCIIVDTRYDIEKQMYLSEMNLYIGHKERWLP